ncbi:MAG: HAMP domain-containing histidine kinase [Clostridiales bacterium]|nr:HAMP domain-containing histidine kinase [Clostridiales bacterium]
MKKYARLVITIVCVYIAAILLFVLLTNTGLISTSVSNEHILLLNDITQTAGDNWKEPNAFDSIKSDVDYMVLDQNNSVVYDSRTKGSSSERMSVENAMKMRYPYSYVTRDNNILGYVILLDDGRDSYNSLRLGMTAAFAVCGLLIVAGAVIYGIYVQKNIIGPFKKMERFAGKVAEGNLNEPLMLDKNNMFGSFTESFDIMREKLAASKDRELALQKKEQELVASLSHDLKTPVTGIKVTSELLKAKHEMNGGDEEEITKLDNIYKKADEIDRLVTDLFSSTLENLGEFKVNCKDEPSSVLNDIVVKHDDKGLIASGSIPGVIINIDTKRMSQVVGNILYNSYKYANTKIDIEYKVIEDYLEMKIRDYGPGVPEEELDLITNKFYRGKKQKDSNADGSGLGLYIARILMEKMNGELIPSNQDKGFAITLLIPLG